MNFKEYYAWKDLTRKLRKFARENKEALSCLDDASDIDSIISQLDKKVYIFRRSLKVNQQKPLSMVEREREKRRRTLINQKKKASLWGWGIEQTDKLMLWKLNRTIGYDYRKNKRPKEKKQSYDIIYDKDMRLFYSHGNHQLHHWFPLSVWLVEQTDDCDIFKCHCIKNTKSDFRFIAISKYTVSVRSTLESAKKGYDERIARHVTKKLFQ